MFRNPVVGPVPGARLRFASDIYFSHQRNEFYSAYYLFTLLTQIDRRSKYPGVPFRYPVGRQANACVRSIVSYSRWVLASGSELRKTLFTTTMYPVPYHAPEATASCQTIQHVSLRAIRMLMGLGYYPVKEQS
jgi:hypothetical protein